MSIMYRNSYSETAYVIQEFKIETMEYVDKKIIGSTKYISEQLALEIFNDFIMHNNYKVRVRLIRRTTMTINEVLEVEESYTG